MHIFFSGIGGVGIGPLAMLALDAGFTISGSDLKESDMVKELARRGVDIYIGQDGSQISAAHTKTPIEWFVYSSALPSGHPELAFCEQQSIKVSKRADFLNHIIKEKRLRLIAVAGTHGKTTVTGMLIWALKQQNIPLSYSIGTQISFGPAAHYEPGSEYFVYECDEFDRNFLHFKPYCSLIVSYDYDHPDTYPTPDDYREAFVGFIQQSQHTYLYSDTAQVLNIQETPSKSIFSKTDPGISTITLPGTHTKQNAWLAAQCLADILPESNDSEIIQSLNTFPGTSRRFEKLGDNLYSDYAHHPSEIKATLQMALEVNPHVVVVYQPHQNIRQHEIVKEGGYKDAFVGAEKVYWLPTYLSREDSDLTVLSSELLIESAANLDSIVATEADDGLWDTIESYRNNGKLVLVMSAGDLDSWLRNQLQTHS